CQPRSAKKAQTSEPIRPDEPVTSKRFMGFIVLASPPKSTPLPRAPQNGRRKSARKHPVGDSFADLQRCRGGRGWRIAHIDRTWSIYDQEIINQTAVGQERLGPDSGGRRQQVLRTHVRN